MISQLLSSPRERNLDGRARFLFNERLITISNRNNHVLSFVFLAQWALCLIIAIVRSPTTWTGDAVAIHPHLYLAFFLGGALSLYPVYLIRTSRNVSLNCYVIAFSQMMTSALIIHLTGGRIESHFHIFGSLAFLAAYRDWKLLLFATLLTTVDHFVRGAMAPESLYGVFQADSFRALEHFGWVAFEDLVLLSSMYVAREEMAKIAEGQAQLESTVRVTEETMGAQVQKSDDLLRLTINALPSFVSYLNRDQTYKFWNKTYDTWFGLDKTSNRIDLKATVGPQAAIVLEENRRRAFAGEEAHFDLSLILATGEERQVEMFYLPDLSSTGEVRGLIVLGHDITDRVEAQATIAQQRADIATASKFSALGEMAGGVAHEINTPLSNILLLADQIKDGLNSDMPDLDELLHNSEHIGATVNRIAKIVNGLKRMSRSTDGEGFTKETIDSVLEQTLNFCHERFKSKGIELSVICPLDFKIDCKSVQLSQVILNLLNNAYDAIIELPEKWVKIEVKEAGEFALISVEDSGRGISGSMAEKIFQPFFDHAFYFSAFVLCFRPSFSDAMQL